MANAHFHRASRIGATLVPLTLLLAVLLPTLTVNGADPEAINKQFKAIQKKISDPLAGAAEYQAVREQLRELLTTTNAAIEGLGGSQEDHPLNSSHARVLSLLNEVNARLPREPKPEGRVSGFPVPEFADGSVLARLADELREAQAALGAELAEPKKDVKRLNELLVRLILAEENLAWEAGWPFDKKEAEKYESAQGLTPGVYLSRRARGIENIDKQMAEELGKSGRGSPRQFVIHSAEGKEVYQQISKELAELRGDVTKVWSRGTKVFDAAERRALFGSVGSSSR